MAVSRHGRRTERRGPILRTGRARLDRHGIRGGLDVHAKSRASGEGSARGRGPSDAIGPMQCLRGLIRDAEIELKGTADKASLEAEPHAIHENLDKLKAMDVA